MKYFIITYGCEANKADSERIARHLEMDGHKKASNEKEAKLIVVNACSVRQSAIDRVREKINKYKSFSKTQNKKVILAGCILEKDKKKFGEKVDEIWHPDEYFDLKPLYSDSSIAYVPITSGCDNFCTYCAVPYTRGREKSRPAKDIIKEVGNLAKNKYKEIWLLGQNVNSYKSGKINFPKLLLHLNTIVDKCNAKCCLRFTSPHPKDFSDELIKAIASCNKVTKYINLPVQSGDNEILKKMNRNYTREHYIKLVGKIRKAIPDIKISTDVIVGFPGETRKQFQNTVELFKKIGFDKAYVARYSPRPGTVSAEKMKDNVSPKEKKKRWDIINKIANNPSTALRARKIIVVLGPTASGKSDLAVDVAREFGNMEIISADSRQVYKGMDIGSGKITKKEMRGIKHHLLDVISPKKIFSAGDFKKLGEKAINEILEKKKVPIVCGGTGFYIHALLEGLGTAGIKPDWNLRKKLEKKSIDELFKMLKKLNKERASNIDAKNKRRLIRAIEIQYGEVRPPNIERYDVLYLGIKKKHKNLKELIHKRLLRRIKQGMIVEVKRLHKKDISWKRLDGLGLEYRFVSRYLRGLTTKEEMIEQLNTAIVQYSKRQMTWFKKYSPQTKWVKKNEETYKLVKKFL